MLASLGHFVSENRGAILHALVHRGVTLEGVCREDVENYSFALSSILCWCRGFMAASQDSSRDPIGVEPLRSLNIELKAALAATEKRHG